MFSFCFRSGNESLVKMKCYISVVCVLSALLAVTLAAPATPEGSEVTLHTQVHRLIFFRSPGFLINLLTLLKAY